MEITTFWNKITLHKLEVDDVYQLNLTNNALSCKSRAESATISYNTQSWNRVILVTLFVILTCMLSVIIGEYYQLITCPIIIIVYVGLAMWWKKYTVTCGSPIEIRYKYLDLIEFERVCGFDQFDEPELVIDRTFSITRIYKKQSKFMMVRINKWFGYTEKVISTTFKYEILFGCLVRIHCGDRHYLGLTGSVDMDLLEELIEEEFLPV